MRGGTPMRRFIAIASVVAASFALAAPPAHAHPVHATIGEAVWNPAKHALELSIRVRAIDLIEAPRPGEPLDLAAKDRERVARDDQRILSYLKTRFTVTRPAG